MKNIVLSIVLPTKNRADLLDMALESIAKQRTDFELFEVIVIDNGSSDNTKDVAERYKNRIKNFRYLYDARPGLHVGRNRGIIESRGKIVGYLDDDVILFPNWINTVLNAFEDEKVMCVCGSVIPKEMKLVTSEFCSKYVVKQGNFQFAYPISCFWERGISENDMRVHPAKITMMFGGNSIYRKKVLYACQGFHPDGMPNNLLMYRGDGESYVTEYIFKHKMKAIYCAQASVYHQIDVNRVTNTYVHYMLFRNGISNMYKCLRESGGAGGFRFLKNRCKLRNLIKTKTFYEICGGCYLFTYYIFYERVRRWIHKENYL